MPCEYASPALRKCLALSRPIMPMRIISLYFAKRNPCRCKIPDPMLVQSIPALVVEEFKLAL